MRKRVEDKVLQEIIDNNGCRKNSLTTINATGIVRLALDLKEARGRIRELESKLFPDYD